MVMTWQPRFSHSRRISARVMLYVVRICGNCVRRMPMKPVSFMTSRMSVKGTRGKEFHRLAPRAQRTFLFAGSFVAARARVAASAASADRRVIIVNDVTPFGVWWETWLRCADGGGAEQHIPDHAGDEEEVAVVRGVMDAVHLL